MQGFPRLLLKAFLLAVAFYLVGMAGYSVAYGRMLLSIENFVWMLPLLFLFSLLYAIAKYFLVSEDTLARMEEWRNRYRERE